MILFWLRLVFLGPDENERRKRKEGHNVMWLRLMVTQKGGKGEGGVVTQG